MKKIVLAAFAAGLVMAAAQPATAQSADEKVITTVHAAPGKYDELVKWMAEVDRVRAEAGLEPRQIYRHHNGANWDFLIIDPPLVEGEDEKLQAAAKALGISTSARAFRELVMDHEDTIVGGPYTGGEIQAQLSQ